MMSKYLAGFDCVLNSSRNTGVKSEKELQENMKVYWDPTKANEHRKQEREREREESE